MRRAILLPVLLLLAAPAAAQVPRDTRSIAQMACLSPPPPQPTSLGSATPDDIVVSTSQKVRNPDHIAYAVACGAQRIVRLYFSRDSARYGWGVNRFTDVQRDRWQNREYAAVRLQDGRRCTYDMRVIMVDANRKEHEHIGTFNVCRWNMLVMRDLD